MKNLCVVVFVVAICFVLVGCYEYKEDYHSDEDNDSDEVNYDYDEEPHQKSYKGHKHGYENELQEKRGVKIEEDKTSPQWKYTKPIFKNIKEEESLLQQNIKQVFGSNRDGVNQDLGKQWSQSGQLPVSENSMSDNGQVVGFFPSSGQHKVQQRSRRQAPNENKPDVIEIDGTNVKFNQDQGSLVGIIPTPAIEENGMPIGAELKVNNEQISIWTTPEPRVSELEKSVNDDLQPNAAAKQSETTIAQQTLVGETKVEETENVGISLINDGSVSQITPNEEKQPIPLKIGLTDDGLKFNQGFKAEFDNGYNQGFKDGYHKGAKEGFDHGARHGCHPLAFNSNEHMVVHEKDVAEVHYKEEKPIFEEEVKESDGGDIIVENQGAVAEVETPAATPILEEEVKEVGGGNVMIAHEENIAHVNIPDDNHHCDKHVKEEGYGEVKLEQEGGSQQVAAAAVVSTISEDEVKYVGGGGLTVVQADGVVHAETPSVIPVPQEQKKEVIKTSSKDQHKYWNHGHGDDHFDHHGNYYGHHHGHHGYDYHGHQNSYPQYHGYQHENKDSHGPEQGYYHGSYHGNHNAHHQGSKDPHYDGSKDDYHHSGPGYHHDYPHDSGEWDSSEEDSDSEECETKPHFKKRSIQVPVFYDLKDAPKLFSQFLEDHNKKYRDEIDYQKHYMNFVKNLEIINEMNAKGGTASFEINMFADLDDEELASITG